MILASTANSNATSLYPLGGPCAVVTAMMIVIVVRDIVIVPPRVSIETANMDLGPKSHIWYGFFGP